MGLVAVFCLGVLVGVLAQDAVWIAGDWIMRGDR